MRYYESGKYKGLPALVPFDLQNGWYAAIKSTVAIGGSIKAYDDSGRISVTVKTLPTNFYGNFRLHPNGEVGDLCIDLSNPDYIANNLGNIFTEGLDTILGKMQQAFEAHSRVFYRNFREEFKGQHSNNVKKTY